MLPRKTLITWTIVNALFGAGFSRVAIAGMDPTSLKPTDARKVRLISPSPPALLFRGVRSGHVLRFESPLATPLSWVDQNGVWNGGTTAVGGLTTSALTTPTGTAVTAATTGGTLLNTTQYCYRVAATNTYQNTAAAAEVCNTTAAGPDTFTETVTWTAVAGATGYRVYCRTTGAELLCATITSGLTTSWLDDGSVVPAGAIPAVNTVLAIRIPNEAGIYNVNGQGLRITAAGALAFSSATMDTQGGAIANALIGGQLKLQSATNDTTATPTIPAILIGPTVSYTAGDALVHIQQSDTTENFGVYQGGGVFVGARTTATLPATCKQGALHFDTTTATLKMCQPANTWVNVTSGGATAHGSFGGYGQATGGPGGGQNELQAFRGAFIAGKAATTTGVACSWGTAGAGAGNVEIQVWNETGGAEVCAGVLGACTTAALSPLSTGCGGALAASSVYTIRLKDGTNCATANPINIFCNVTYTE